jgi:hypothetical protein
VSLISTFSGVFHCFEFICTMSLDRLPLSIVARVYTTILTIVPYTRTWYLARAIQFFGRVFTFTRGRAKSGPYGGRAKSGPYGDVSWVGF